MPDIEKAVYWLSRAILKVMDMPEGYTRDNVIADINSATEAMKEDKPQNGSGMRFYVEDSAGYIQYYGEHEHKYFDSLQEARKAISIWLDLHSRAHFPYYKIYNEAGVFIEKVEREPEDDE